MRLEDNSIYQKSIQFFRNDLFVDESLVKEI